MARRESHRLFREHTGINQIDLFPHEAPPLLAVYVQSEVIIEGGTELRRGEAGQVDVHVEKVLTLVNQRLHHGDQEVIMLSVLCVGVITIVNFSQRMSRNRLNLNFSSVTDPADFVFNFSGVTVASGRPCNIYWTAP